MKALLMLLLYAPAMAQTYEVRVATYPVILDYTMNIIYSSYCAHPSHRQAKLNRDRYVGASYIINGFSVCERHRLWKWGGAK